MELKTYFAQDAAGNIISSAIVNVFLQGTTTLATGLTRADGTPLENPFAADGSGRIQFRAPDGYYDVQVSAGPGIIQTLTIQCVDYSGAKADADRAEVAADRAGVSAEQAQNSLNSITGINTNFEQNSREQWRRSLAEAGLTLVSGSFEEGATANSSTDAVWHIAGGQCYTWGGAFPKAVPAESTPTSTGGVGPSAWISVGDASLRSNISTEDGAGLIGTTQGITVQKTFDDVISPPLKFLSDKHFNSGFTKQYILGVTDRQGEASAQIKADAGRSDGAFPQGIAVDPLTGEILITRGWTDSTPTYVHIYDSNMNFKAVVRAGGGYSEGIIIGYVNGERRIALSRAGTGYAVYTLPATESIGSLYAATLLFEQPSANHLGQINSYGNYALMVLNLDSTDQYLRRGVVSVYNLQDVLTTPDPVRVTWAKIPYYLSGGGASDNPGGYGALVPKGQAVCLSPTGVATYSGAAWMLNTTERHLAGNTLQFSEISHTGAVINSQNLHPKYVLEEFAGKGWTRPGGQQLDNTEAEGLTYCSAYGYVFMTVVSERVFVTVGQNASLINGAAENLLLDFTRAVKPNVTAGSCMSVVHDIVCYDSINGTVLTSIDDIIDYTKYLGIREYSVTCKQPITIGTETYSGVYNLIQILNIDGINTVVTVIQDRTKVRKYFTSAASSPRNFVASALQENGSVSTLDMNGRTSMLTLAPDNIGQMAVTRAPGATGNHTAARFDILSGAALGSIVLSTTGTSYNTTSDVRLKNDHGEITNALSILDNMFENKAFRMAAFKSEPENIMPMLMAQHLNKTAPYAVSKENDEWSVDPSKLVPLLLAMIYELHQKLK